MQDNHTDPQREFLAALQAMTEVGGSVHDARRDVAIEVRLITIGSVVKAMTAATEGREPDWAWATKYLREVVEREGEL